MMQNTQSLTTGVSREKPHLTRLLGFLAVLGLVVLGLTFALSGQKISGGQTRAVFLSDLQLYRLYGSRGGKDGKDLLDEIIQSAIKRLGLRTRE
jgi:hypothetical protein